MFLPHNQKSNTLEKEREIVSDEVCKWKVFAFSREKSDIPLISGDEMNEGNLLWIMMIPVKCNHLQGKYIFV